MIDTDYAYDITLPESTPARAESLLYYLELATRSINLYGNANETVFMRFTEGAISTLTGKPLK